MPSQDTSDSTCPGERSSPPIWPGLLPLSSASLPTRALPVHSLYYGPAPVAQLCAIFFSRAKAAKEGRPSNSKEQRKQLPTHSIISPLTRTLLYHSGKSPSFLIPIATSAAPSILASSFLFLSSIAVFDGSFATFFSGLAAPAGVADLRAAKSTSLMALELSLWAREMRNLARSVPERKMVESEVDG
jgi:hypothetical protein